MFINNAVAANPSQIVLRQASHVIVLNADFRASLEQMEPKSHLFQKIQRYIGSTTPSSLIEFVPIILLICSQTK
jgi:hypothetical protein